MQSQAVWIIDNDLDDQDVLKDVWKELKLTNELIFLKDAEEAMRMLEQVRIAPFIIICELNLPGVNGFDLRQKMLDRNKKRFKSVPFITGPHKLQNNKL
jgi:two-component SAPR family response regulator